MNLPVWAEALVSVAYGGALGGTLFLLGGPVWGAWAFGTLMFNVLMLGAQIRAVDRNGRA